MSDATKAPAESVVIQPAFTDSPPEVIPFFKPADNTNDCVIPAKKPEAQKLD
jgi:hypothetical protein